MNCIDYMNKISFGISIAFCVLYSCTSRTGQKTSEETLQVIHWHRTRLRKLWQNLSSKRLLRKKFKNHQRAAV